MKKIDCHRHCSYDEKDLAQLISGANQLEIEKIFLFGHNLGLAEKSFDEKIWGWHLKFPDLIVPLACDFKYDKTDVNYAKECLEKGFAGLGELLIGHSGAQAKDLAGVKFDDEVPLAIFKLVGEYNSFVLVHCNDEFSRNFLRAVEQCKNTSFIWAHIAYDFKQGLNGNLRCAKEIEGLLVKHQNLMFDISFWEKDAVCMDTVEYIRLLEKYSTRFLWGLDLTDNYAQMQMEWYKSYDVVLSQLSDFACGNILYQNAKTLLQNRCNR